MSKYIKILDGFAINRKTAWIGHVQKERTEGFLWFTVKTKKNDSYFFEFGDKKQSFTNTYDTEEEALKEWEEVLLLINEIEVK